MHEGRMNRSALEVNASLLLVSQFTLYGDCRKGRRPSFDAAAPPDLARELYEYVVRKVREKGLVTGTGVFQAHMEVELVNDGPGNASARELGPVYPHVILFVSFPTLPNG